MRNSHFLGFLLLLLLVLSKQGEALKVKSFFFGLGGGDKKEEKNENKQEQGSKSTQDTKGISPAAGVSKSEGNPSENSSKPPEEAKKLEGSHPEEKPPVEAKKAEGGHSEEKPPENHPPAEGGEPKQDNLPFIPSPPPPPPSIAPEHEPEHHPSSSPPPPPPPPSGCSCGSEKPLSDCCHETVYGEKKIGEKRNATITGTITGTITDSVLTAKTGDEITVKHNSDKPTPECERSNKQSVNTVTHEAHTNLHSVQSGKLPSLEASPNVGKSKFPNGANFIPLVLDANTGQYGVELKTMDLLVTGQDEKIKPFDMLIPFVNESGQIKFVTRRRLRQLVKSGLSKGFSEGVPPFTQEAMVESAAEPKEDNEEKRSEEKRNEEKRSEEKRSEEKSSESSAAEKGREAANSAKSLLQEAETVLTGGSLFEPSEKKEDDNKKEEKDDKKDDDNKNDDEKAEEGESSSEKKDSSESEETSESSGSETSKSSKSDDVDSAMGAQDSVSVHASEEEEEEE
ncbi:Uncharacterized protein CTYZ_00002847 [Cryptosporidium tyzzeri]|nr:Uncharacterized protein CTYZ_00002847 [Cryptosporidium tyzzeri]